MAGSDLPSTLVPPSNFVDDMEALVTVKSPNSLTGEKYAFARALRVLLSRRRKGEFVSTERMDARLGRLIAEKRRAHGFSS